MIHTRSVVIEMDFDDENGEFTPPSLSEIERMFSSLREILHAGFTKNYFVEAAEGSLEEAFGIEGYDDDMNETDVEENN